MEQSVNPQTRLDSHSFVTVCEYEFVGRFREGLCSRSASCSHAGPGCARGDKGIPSGGWSIPVLITALC